MVGAVIEATIVLVALYLIVTNSEGFSGATNAIGGVYVNSVKALQGR